MDDLDFKDFSLLRDAPVNAAESTISGSLLDATSSGAQNGESATKPHFLTLAYYQRFFDVEEEQVFSRILNSTFPRRTGNFITDFVQPNPDLWGPFWISVTLVFSIAIVGNFAHFLHNYGSGEEFISDFSYVTGATSLVFGYVMLMPALIYTFLWYHRPAALQYSFFDLLCAYGYSLSVFIPISIVCPLLPFNWARWAFTMSSAMFSGAVLVIALWAMVKEDPNRLGAIGFALLAFVAHALLAVCLKEFFFDATGFTVPAEFIQPPANNPTTASSPSLVSSTNSSLG